MKHTCPICGKVIKPSPDNKGQKAVFLPFCSARCKLIDLGAWLDEKYTITSGFKPEQSGELTSPSSDINTKGRQV